MGGSSWQWAAVLPSVAGQRQAIAYDRSGFGGSDPDSEPRSLGRAADDLEDLMGAVEAGSFVLVGHSWGGPIVRTVASRQRSSVRGLVLVDPTDETCDVYFDRRAMRVQRGLNTALPTLARMGLAKLALRRMAATWIPEVREQMAAIDGSVASARSHQREFESLEVDLKRLRTEPPAIGDIPTTIISGTRPVRFGARTRHALVATHARSAAALPRGRHVRAERSTHFVQLMEPELVGGEIRRLASDAA